MRGTGDSHYLHDKKGLEAVVSPPIDGVQSLCWLPGTTELLVATRGGHLVQVEPVMGTRTIATGLGEPGALAVSADRSLLAVLVRGRGVELRQVQDGRLVWTWAEPLLTRLSLCFSPEGLLVSGEGLDGRVAVVLDAQGRVALRERLSPSAAVGVTPKGRLVLAQVTHQGPEMVVLGRGQLSDAPTTSHRLHFSRGGLLYGIAEGGVTVWPNRDRNPITIRCFGVSCADLSQDGTRLLMGTRSGGVALAGILADAPHRGQPGQTGGHDQPVSDVAFCDKGRWAASAGARCWLWTW
jgi:WD40 repeat protein